LVLFLIPLQFVYLFCNLSKCILLFFSCISSLLLLVILSIPVIYSTITCCCICSFDLLIMDGKTVCNM
jgi:hypothetical protein